MGASSNLPYCPRCACEFCTAQRAVVLRNQQILYEYQERVEQERQEREDKIARMKALNDRVCAAAWMIVLAHPRQLHRAATKSVALHMETSVGLTGGRVRAYVNRLQERMLALAGDHSPEIRRLRAAGALTTDEDWAKPERDYLPVECEICGGMYTEGRHCKRNSCRRRRGR